MYYLLILIIVIIFYLFYKNINKINKNNINIQDKINVLNFKNNNNYTFNKLIWENTTCDPFYQPCNLYNYYNNGYFYPI